MVNMASKFKVTLISENVIASTIRYISSRHTQKGLKMYEEVMKGLQQAASKVYLTISCYIGVIYIHQLIMKHVYLDI